MLRTTLMLLGSLATSTLALAQDYRIETVTAGLEHPWSLAFLPDGRMLVTERVGRLRIRDVRSGPDGALYLLTDNAEGRVLRVVPAE